jgi:hypothetical protein
MQDDVFNYLKAYNYNDGTDRAMYYQNHYLSEDTSEEYVPTYEDCIEIGDTPIEMLDVSYTRKGELTEGVIIYDNKPNIIKRNKIKKLVDSVGWKCFDLYEISSETVLNRIEKPNNIYELCNKVI